MPVEPAVGCSGSEPEQGLHLHGERALVVIVCGKALETLG